MCGGGKSVVGSELDRKGVRLALELRQKTRHPQHGLVMASVSALLVALMDKKVDFVGQV